MPGLRLVSINIERAKHLDVILPFIEKENPDILCIQELREQDVPLFVQPGYDHIYAPMLRHPADGEPSVIGVGIFSKHALSEKRAEYYKGNADEIPDHDPESDDKGSQMNCVLTSALLMHEDRAFRIATTHFTWAAKGGTNEAQQRDVLRLFDILESFDEFVLCGDFNSPRGTGIFNEIVARYKDNIPLHYDWSIDLPRHVFGDSIRREAALQGRAGYMVDGLFSTGDIEVSNVRLQDGVSDHMAIVARIQKRSEA